MKECVLFHFRNLVSSCLYKHGIGKFSNTAGVTLVTNLVLMSKLPLRFWTSEGRGEKRDGGRERK